MLQLYQALYQVVNKLMSVIAVIQYTWFNIITIESDLCWTPHLTWIEGSEGGCSAYFGNKN